MNKRIADYTVIFERQKRVGSDEECYVAFVPVLGIATDGDTLEESQKAIKSLIQFHVDSLVGEREEVPVESQAPFVTRIQTNLPK